MTTEVSAGERPVRQRETLADTFVVDADVHVHEDPAELAEYAESPWDVGLREIATVEERYLDLPGMSPRAEYRVPFPGGSNRRQIVTSARREVPLLQERPSATMRRFYYGTQPIEEPERRADLVSLFELFDGEHRAMFASDWPHHDFDHPQHVFGLPFSPEARRRIMGLNAAEFFGLDVPQSYA